MTPTPKKLEPAYCYCSELAYSDILARQQADPLPFKQAMRVHCQSGDRCGRCLWKLEQLLRSHDCYVSD
uniref:(2Fe-2S)-binding protein n=1 Tax=Oscillatoriales cyanobacterium SpSt-402 TaxID=2282168 RepID=A0A832H4A1_9CYAN